MSDRYMNKGQVTDVLSQRRFLATSARPDLQKSNGCAET
jgi:hypothetical protein